MNLRSMQTIQVIMRESPCASQQQTNVTQFPWRFVKNEAEMMR